MTKITIPQAWLSPLSKQEQIYELNNEVRCKLGVSKVDGIGVIAIRDIRKGEKCFVSPFDHLETPRFYNISFGNLSKLLPKVKELVLQRWASVVNGSVFRSPNDDAGLLFFVNHSTRPNYDVVSDTALRDIKDGEELFEDYRAMENWAKVRPIEKNPWLND